MIQQLTNTRTDKQLTKSDLSRIAYACGLNFFHNNSMFNPWPLGLFLCMNTWWVKRINSNSYQYQLSWISTSNHASSPNNMFYGIGNIEAMTKEQLIAELKEKLIGYNKYQHSDLFCEKDGDERVLIEIHYRKINFDKRKLGLFILEPKAFDIYGTAFFYQLIIAPKPGLFPAQK